MADILIYCSVLSFVVYAVSDMKVSLFDSAVLLSMTPLFLFYNFWLKQPESDEDTKEKRVLVQKSEEPKWSRSIEKPFQGIFGLVIPKYTGKLSQILVSYCMIAGIIFVTTRMILVLIGRVLCHVPVSESMLGLTVVA